MSYTRLKTPIVLILLAFLRRKTFFCNVKHWTEMAKLVTLKTEK